MIPRRSSLRSNSMIKRDEALAVKFPPIAASYMTTHVIPNQQKVDTGSPGFNSSRNSIAGSRRNSMFRRGSVSQDPNFQHTVTFAPKTEGDILKDCVPMSSVPRFSCELFDEGQYTTFKGYEYLLRKEIETRYPEYSTILGGTTSSINTITLNREILRQKISQFDDEFQTVLHTKENRTKRRSRTNFNDGIESDFAKIDPMEKEKIKLLMSRHLQFAQLLLDSLKAGTVVRSNKYVCKLPQKNFNLIQAFNWWNSSWQNFFITSNRPDKIMT